MNTGYEQFLLQRMLQSDVGGWTSAVYVAAMFAVIMWRKESVVNWSLFRASYLLFAAAIVLPPILQPLLQLVGSGSMQSRGFADTQIFLWIVYTGTGPALMAGAVVCGLGSMMPRRFRFSTVTPPGPPQPHPLD